MDVNVSLADGVVRIGLNRPDKKNALTAAMYQALADAFGRYAEEPAARCFLLHGSAEAFTAGNDLADFRDAPPAGDNSPVFQFLRAIAGCPKPVVAAVCGPAIGVGTTLLLHCDLVYAGDNTRFAVPFAQLGLCPEAASSLLLPAIAGHQAAAEKLLLGEPFGADEARRMGFVNQVLPAAAVFEHALAQAAKLVALPASSLRVTKRLMKQAQSALVAAQMNEEGVQFRQMLGAPEAQEAFAAFFEKRRPDFGKFG